MKKRSDCTLWVILAITIALYAWLSGCATATPEQRAEEEAFNAPAGLEPGPGVVIWRPLPAYVPPPPEEPRPTVIRSEIRTRFVENPHTGGAQ